MKFVWHALLGIVRTAYFTYAVWCLMLPVALLRQGALAALTLYGALAVCAIAVVYLRRDRGATLHIAPNPWRIGFIRRSSPSAHGGFKPGWFTHMALYVGDITESDRAGVNPLCAALEPALQKAAP